MDCLSSEFTLVADFLSRQRLRSAAGARVVVPVRLGDADSATAPSPSLVHGLGMHRHRTLSLHRLCPPSGCCCTFSIGNTVLNLVHHGIEVFEHEHQR